MQRIVIVVDAWSIEGVSEDLARGEGAGVEVGGEGSDSERAWRLNGWV
jgi:hypothetical protein